MSRTVARGRDVKVRILNIVDCILALLRQSAYYLYTCYKAYKPLLIIVLFTPVAVE